MRTSEQTAGMREHKFFFENSRPFISPLEEAEYRESCTISYSPVSNAPSRASIVVFCSVLFILYCILCSVVSCLAEEGSSDFRAEEFVGKYSVKQLCDALKTSKVLNENEKCDTVDDLNQLLRRADLYNKITAAGHLQPSENLMKLNETYDKTKKDDDLKKLNRRALEEFYPQEPPKRLEGSSDFRVEEFVGKYTVKQLCDALKKSKVLNENEKCDTVDDLNQLLQRAELYNKITAVSHLHPSEDLTKLRETYDKTKKNDDLKKLNRRALEEFYPQETPKRLENETTIQSDALDYEETASTYTAKGHAKVERGLSKIEAAEIIYNEETSEVHAEGDVVYEDPAVIIRGTRAELNLDDKTGVLYEAKVFSKKDNFHITGPEIDKINENEYTLKKASFTTCDAPVPAWCFNGKDVDLLMGEKLKSKDTTFAIEGLPVLYAPYLSVPVSNERKSGLLIPSIGYVKTQGLHYEQPLYWAISENSDATFILDEYSSRGTGLGAEYRFLEPDGSKGNFWTYHLRDNVLGQDFWVARDTYENRQNGSNVTGYLNVDYINSSLFYTEYNPYLISPNNSIASASSFLSGITQRFLESTGEVSARLETSRLYLDSQFLVDLQSGAGASQTLQKLPEIGYFMNPRPIGPLVFSLDSSLANFVRGVGAAGQRLDIYPMILYSFGSDVTVTQALGLRETAYSISGTDSFGSTPHRESFDYSITAQSRLMKQYPSFVHIMEPSVQFTYSPPAESNLPLFDSTELYQKTSAVQFSLQNWLMDKDGEFLVLRLTQAYDGYTDPHALPLALQAAVLRPLVVRAEVDYDVPSGTFEKINSDVRIPLFGTASLSVGERYSDPDNILTYTFGLNYPFSKTLSFDGITWFDVRNGGFQEAIAKLTYQKQCWGMTMIYTKSTTNYGISVLFNLLGLGTIRLF